MYLSSSPTIGYSCGFISTANVTTSVLGYPIVNSTGKQLQAKAKLIESDIAFDRFDPTLAKYKPQSAPSTVTPLTPLTPKIPFIDLWEKYTLYKSSQITASTLTRDYGKIAKRLQAMPTTLEDAVGVRDWLRAQI